MASCRLSPGKPCPRAKIPSPHMPRRSTRPYLSTLALTLALVLATAPAVAQEPAPKPIGSSHPSARPLTQVARLEVGAIDRVAIAAEDARNDELGLAPRFAMPFAVDVSPATNGTWDVLDATWSLWRLRVLAPDASHVNLGFTRFALPAQGQLMVYAADERWVVRPFDAGDNNAANVLWTPVVRGQEVVAELFVRTVDVPAVMLRLTHVGSGYRFFGAGDSALPFAVAGSGTCNVDVICPQGNGWRSEIPAIAAYSTGGSIFCTGFMVNNTAQDRRSFFMTANHCGITSGNAASIVVYWNYENTVCGGPNNGTLTRFNTGSTWRAGYTTSDFTLVELSSSPNPAWGVTYAGWDRSGTDASSAVAIHHPSADVKKISFENQATATTSYGGSAVPGDGTHVRVIDWDTGTTEPGSSGSPLFDQNHHVIGQLHGGAAACGNNSSDWYGKFSRSWTGGGASSSRLSNWLDPIGTGQSALDTLGTSGVASASVYGIGCVTSYATFFELFGAGLFDLAGAPVRSILLTRQGGGYRVSAGSNAWVTPVSANLGLTDDSVAAAYTLPFTLQHPGGSTTQVRMCSNGYVWLNGASTLADYTPSIGELVADASRHCPLWTDLNPGTGGTTHIDLVGGVVVLTWLGVREFGQTGTCDVQCAIWSDGRVEYRWRGVTLSAHDALVGYSPGSGVATPSSIDISASLPFSTAPDSAGLTLAANNRPVLGTAQSMTVSNIRAGTSIGVAVVGFGKYDPGLDLTSIGMPTCRQHTTLDVLTTFPGSPATSYAWSLPIPNNVALAGAHVYCTALTLTSGANSLGILSANGVDLKLDRS